MKIEPGLVEYTTNPERTFSYIQSQEMKREENHLKMVNGIKLELKL